MWPLKSKEDCSINVCILERDTGERSEKACVTIQEKSFSACYASLLAHLLQIRNPSQTVLYISLPEKERKRELEDTLKNMNFVYFTVTTF